jgi:hypothetical protein
LRQIFRLRRRVEGADKKFIWARVVKDTPFVLTYAAKNSYDAEKVNDSLFGGDTMSTGVDRTINLVEYGRLLALKSQDIIQFLIAAKSVSAGNLDVPARALQLIAGDINIEADFEAGFIQIEQAHKELRKLIYEAKTAKQV